MVQVVAEAITLIVGRRMFFLIVASYIFVPTTFCIVITMPCLIYFMFGICMVLQFTVVTLSSLCLKETTSRAFPHLLCFDEVEDFFVNHRPIHIAKQI